MAIRWSPQRLSENIESEQADKEDNHVRGDNKMLY